MGYSYPLIECSKTGSHGRRCIPLDNQIVGLFDLDDFIQPVEHSRRNLFKGLIMGHDIEVVVRMQIEQVQQGINHFAMLRRYTDATREFIGMTEKPPHQWSHLD